MKNFLRPRAATRWRAISGSAGRSRWISVPTAGTLWPITPDTESRRQEPVDKAAPEPSSPSVFPRRGKCRRQATKGALALRTLPSTGHRHPRVDRSLEPGASSTCAPPTRLRRGPFPCGGTHVVTTPRDTPDATQRCRRWPLQGCAASTGLPPAAKCA